MLDSPPIYLILKFDPFSVKIIFLRAVDTD